MEKKEGDKTLICVSFIPEKFAKVDGVVKLKDSHDNWSDGWVVKSVGVLTDEPPDYKKAIREHKKRTGDSLPKSK